MSDATYPDGKKVAEIAAKNEYGDPSNGQVPRPFFRRMIAEEKKHWAEDLVTLIRAKDYDLESALDVFGGTVKEDLQQSIRDFTSPALRPSTIAKKGFAKPLIDTGNMLSSVTHRVVMK